MPVDKGASLVILQSNPATVATRQGVAVPFLTSLVNESPPGTSEKASAQSSSQPSRRISPRRFEGRATGADEPVSMDSSMAAHDSL